jgi:hypothetical protein
MLLKDLFNRVLVESGQFLFGTHKIELKKDNFFLLVQNSLSIYDDFEPKDNRFSITVANTSYTFVESPAGSWWTIPKFIIEIIPVVISGLPWYFQNWMTWQGKGFGDEFNPLSSIWKYKSPTLYTEYAGQFTVWAVYSRAQVQVPDPDDPDDTTWDLPDITTRDNRFIRHLTGKFMQALSLERDAFTLHELPLKTNADTLMSKGEKWEEDALTKMQFQKWYLAQG